MSERQDMIVTLAGDCLINHRLSVFKEPRFLKLRETLHDADVSIANLEVCVTQGEDPPALVAAGGHGAGYQGVPPFCVEELHWMGFKTVCCANNHAQDFGEGGILTTIKYLDQAGMGHAGTGRTLSEASAPVYTDTPRGRVALVSACDWGPRGKADLLYPIPLGALASDPSPFYKGRPGVNLVRYDAVHHVDKRLMEELRRASKLMGFEEAKAARSRGTGGRSEPLTAFTMLKRELDTDREFWFMGTKFALDERFTFETLPYKVDLDRNYRWIREARGQADAVVVGFHQQGGGRPGETPDHTVIFAHGAIDAGADVFAAHGRGRLGGIEFYKGKAILYGLPGFVMQLNQVRHVPPELLERWGLPRDSTALDFLEYRDAAEATGPLLNATAPAPGMAMYSPVFDQSKKLKEVLIHPLEITRGSRSWAGRPLLAEPGSDIFGKVIEAVASYSKPFGTRVEVRGGVGVAYVK